MTCTALGREHRIESLDSIEVHFRIPVVLPELLPKVMASLIYRCSSTINTFCLYLSKNLLGICESRTASCSGDHNDKRPRLFKSRQTKKINLTAASRRCRLQLFFNQRLGCSKAIPSQHCRRLHSFSLVTRRKPSLRDVTRMSRRRSDSGRESSGRRRSDSDRERAGAPAIGAAARHRRRHESDSGMQCFSSSLT